MEEIWKPIKDYEGLYEVSSLGRIKSLGRMVKKFNGHNYSNVTYPSKILKNRISDNGYQDVMLCKENKQKRLMVHRLVAEAFIDNPNNYKEINHISGNKNDNSIFNIEWCTHKQNCMHRSNELKKGCIKKVGQYDLEGNLIKIWDSIIEVSRKLRINNSNIGECCKGRRKTAGGYVWRGLS